MRTKRETENPGLLVRLFLLGAVVCSFAAVLAAQGVAIDQTSATSRNLKVVWDANDPEKILEIKWSPSGLDGTETNLTNTGTFGSDPCASGDVEYFGNSWAPPDPPVGKVLVGAGTSGTRMRGPDSKVVISSISGGCVPSANVGVTTLYKFWQGGMAANKMRATRTFSFETPFNRDFRPYIPRLFSISEFSQVIFPNAAGTALNFRTIGGFAGCPFGCEVTDWNGSIEETAWFAINDPATGRGIVVKHEPNGLGASLWLDWDGASNTNASSVLLKKPEGGFTGEVVEKETFCFYDASTWTPSLTLPPGC